MEEFLGARIAKGLPGRTAQRVMAHGLAYGRHHGPVPDDARRPAVLKPNEHEVAAVLELPLAELVDPTRRGRHVIERRGLKFIVPHFAIGGQRVWGATSLMLAEFAGLFDILNGPGK